MEDIKNAFELYWKKLEAYCESEGHRNAARAACLFKTGCFALRADKRHAKAKCIFRCKAKGACGRASKKQCEINSALCFCGEDKRIFHKRQRVVQGCAANKKYDGFNKKECDFLQEQRA